MLKHPFEKKKQTESITEKLPSVNDFSSTTLLYCTFKKRTLI